MNDQEAAKLLSLVKLSYPTAYRDTDRQSAAATVKMWASSFAGVPYPVAERAFDRFRMRSKFPPTVACLAAELKKMYFEAENAAFAHRALGNEENVRKFWALMACTENFAKEKMPLIAAPERSLTDGKMGSARAPRDRLGLADGVSVLDAGGLGISNGRLEEN